MASRVFSALLAMLLVGCAGKSEEITKPKDPLKLRSITLQMAEKANANWPARVALVRIKDAALLPRLTAMKSDGWFGEAGTSFRAAHPDIYVDSWEVVPGTVVGPFKIRLRERVAGLLFCETSASPPPLRLDMDGHVVVSVDDDRCRVSEPEKPKRSWFRPKKKKRDNAN